MKCTCDDLDCLNCFPEYVPQVNDRVIRNGIAGTVIHTGHHSVRGLNVAIVRQDNGAVSDYPLNDDGTVQGGKLTLVQ
jgi:hypothetical protein